MAIPIAALSGATPALRTIAVSGSVARSSAIFLIEDTSPRSSTTARREPVPVVPEAATMDFTAFSAFSSVRPATSTREPAS